MWAFFLFCKVWVTPSQGSGVKGVRIGLVVSLVFGKFIVNLGSLVFGKFIVNLVSLLMVSLVFRLVLGIRVRKRVGLA